MDKKTKLLLRLRAAAWAAAAAVVPAGSFALFFKEEFSSEGALEVLLAMVIAAVVAASISGFIFGWHLLNTEECHDWRTAAAQSIKVTLWAHGFMSTAPIFFVLLAVPFVAARDGLTSTEIIESTNLFAWLILPFFLWFLSIIMMGWFTLPVGVTVGYLLSKHYRQKQPSNV